MMEKTKTALLAGLVVLSLLQSYMLAYSMPGIDAVLPRQDYIKTERMGAEAKVADVVFPEDMVLHFGDDKHTVLYPGMNFYNLIFDRVQGREFKGFQRNNIYVVDWNKTRERDIGVELRFGRGVPVELLKEALKLDGDVAFQSEVINRIWIYKNIERDEVRTYFFSADGNAVYESVRADLTVNDVQNYVGFGEYWTPYRYAGDEIYLPEEPLQTLEAIVGYETYTPEQMQRNLFLDPSETRALVDRSGSQIFTDGKRGLQVAQNGKWINYTDPVAGQGSEDTLSANIYASVQFINQHGGWDGLHRYLQPGPIEDMQGQSEQSIRVVRYQQYYGSYPVIPRKPFMYGQMQLRLQQGVVSEYERSLITINKEAEAKQVRWLPGGKELEEAYNSYSRKSEVIAVFPAMLVSPEENERLHFEPVWAVRLTDGDKAVLLHALPEDYKPPVKTVKPADKGSADKGKEKEKPGKPVPDAGQAPLSSDGSGEKARAGDQGEGGGKSDGKDNAAAKDDGKARR
ncbi:YycH family regulatory protein [Paenibacillus sp. GCM10027626]|uniref:YycH family regulatory protein n=1 Tax=Paenibacillus sp. GCM10027626 TaxID=3273411 RepID=UPI003637CFFE